MRFDTLDSVRAEQLDFVPRERRDRVLRTIFAFVLTITLVFMLAFSPAAAHYAIYTPLLSIAFMALLCLYVVYQEQTTLDLVMSTEYQNLLYSQALSVGASFTLIARREGTVVYASDSIRSAFPDFKYSEANALEGIFDQGMVRKVDRERILGAIYSTTPERLLFSIGNQYEDQKEYVITVEPMARPAGFSVVRGRQYLGQRAGIERMPEGLSATSVDKLAHLLTTSNVAQYTTDAYGRFEYVNPAFEALFGYQPGEIIESRLSLHHLIFSFNDYALTEEYTLGDYYGPAVILSKLHGRQSVEINQSVLRDAQGKALGASGTFRTATA